MSAGACEWLPALAPLVEEPLPAFLDRLEAEPEAADDLLWYRCRWDLRLFCLAILGHRFDRPFNALHLDLFSERKQAWTERDRPPRRVTAAPRGAAKSTIESFASLIHDALYGLEAYTVILSTTQDLAFDLVRDLHTAFSETESYPELHRLYGPFRVTGSATDFTLYTPAGDPRGIRYKGYGWLGAVRGTKHKGIRPTKIVFDDAEHPERVATPGGRAKTWDFLQKDILKAGRPYTLVRGVGTVLHQDSMLAHLLGSPAWQSKRYRALIEEPDRGDLWERCRQIWCDLANPDRLAAARAFYEAHQAEMDAGARVLWPEEEPLFALMQMRWEDPAAFLSEKQNDPRDPSRQIFSGLDIKRCSFDGVTITSAEGRAVKLRDCRVAVWLDPSNPKDPSRRGSRKPDFGAIATVAKDPAGYVYVLRVDSAQDPASSQRARYWRTFEMLGIRTAAGRIAYGYEDNGFQALNDEGFERERQARRAAGKVWQLRPEGETSTQNKVVRISALEPDLRNGWLQINGDPNAVPARTWEQLREFPTATHDDDPDAIERAVNLARSSDQGTIQPARFGIGGYR